MLSHEELQRGLSEILSQQRLAETFQNANSLEGIQSIFKENGLDISGEDLLVLMEQMTLSGEDKELNAEELENVNGGSLISAIKALFFRIGFSSGGGSGGGGGGGGRR